MVWTVGGVRPTIQGSNRVANAANYCSFGLGYCHFDRREKSKRLESLKISPGVEMTTSKALLGFVRWSNEIHAVLCVE